MSLASWVGVAVGVGALIFAWLAWRVSKQELRLAQEEAELRPKLVISFKKVVYRHRPPDPGTQYPHAYILFNVTNDGRSAAHNVHCEISLDERHLIPTLTSCTARTIPSSQSTSDPRPPNRTRSTSPSLPTARPRPTIAACATRLGSPKAPSGSTFPNGSRTGTRG